MFENTDVTSTSDIVGVEVTMLAPTIGNNQDLFSYQNYEVGGSRLLLNARTNGSSPLIIQTGLFFQKDLSPSATEGLGWVVWTTDRQDYIMSYFPIDYVSGHNYIFTISSVVCCADAWDICSVDATIGYSTYDCQPADVTNSGTELAPDNSYGLQNSVFFENQNLPTTDWYDGFTNPLLVGAAVNYNSSHVPVDWDSNHRHTVHLCFNYDPPTDSWPTEDAIDLNMDNTLVDGDIGAFKLAGIPPLCDL